MAGPREVRHRARGRSLRRDFPESTCGCQICRAACLNSPGWFLPDEVPRLARHLGLEPAELFARYLAVGTTHMPDGALRHGIMPHKYRDHKKPGDVWTLDELAEPGRCVFFDRGRCTIHVVRPFECSRMHHSRLTQAVALRHHIVEMWTVGALAPFAALLGRRLVVPPTASRQRTRLKRRIAKLTKKEKRG